MAVRVTAVSFTADGILAAAVPRPSAATVIGWLARAKLSITFTWSTAGFPWLNWMEKSAVSPLFSPSPAIASCLMVRVFPLTAYPSVPKAPLYTEPVTVAAYTTPVTDWASFQMILVLTSPGT
ncbi:hypothetical protein D3C75_1028670 [compost metagenome]